jgi:hypothetical protein
MKLKDKFILNLNIDWRVLIVFAVVMGVLVLAISSAGAQNVNPPNTNDVQSETPTNQSEPPTVNLSNPIELKCNDGLLPTTNGECVSVDTLGTATLLPTGGIVTAATVGGGRHFYLTNAYYATNTVLTACASGYHMASLWEILVVSNLTYDYTHPAAKTKSDSGYGPPSSWNGWVRTGWDSSGSNTTGTGNCLNWTSISDTDYGVSVQLSANWKTAPGDIFTWWANSYSCNYVGPVWCVRN